MTCRTEDLPNSHVSRTAPEAQQESSWSPPGGTLGELVQVAAARVEKLKRLRGALEREANGDAPATGFADALRTDAVAVIAELKRSSPSKGELNSALRAGARATAYEAGGAAAISVLTESTRFGGSLDDLREAVHAVSLPVLRKDFIIDELQILEARAVGAAAVLLIARAVAPRQLARLTRFALEHHMDPLVEVRTSEELERAIDSGARVIGVNARNLETLEIDESVPSALLARVPADVVAIAESGVRDRTSVEALARAGADAVLVGSVLSVAENPTQAVRTLTGVPRVGRDG